MLRVVHNKRIGTYRICHDRWCNKGETSIVYSTDDKRLAELLAERCNDKCGGNLCRNPDHLCSCLRWAGERSWEPNDEYC